MVINKFLSQIDCFVEWLICILNIEIYLKLLNNTMVLHWYGNKICYMFLIRDLKLKIKRYWCVSFPVGITSRASFLIYVYKNEWMAFDDSKFNWSL